MGTDNSGLSINNHIADALRHVMLLYGDSILRDPGLIETLRDHGAFHEHTTDEDILRMIIDNINMPELLSLSHKRDKEVREGIDKTVCDLKYMSSFQENELRTTVYSLLKGMNMNLDLNYTISEETAISESIAIDPDYLIEPPSCPIRPRCSGKEKAEINDETLSKEKTDLHKIATTRRDWKRHAWVAAIAAALATGVYAVFTISDHREEKDPVAVSVTESASEKLYREILEDIHFHNGRLSDTGREKLEKALRDYPEDYWFKFLKEKTK